MSSVTFYPSVKSTHVVLDCLICGHVHEGFRCPKTDPIGNNSIYIKDEDFYKVFYEGVVDDDI